VNRTGRAAGKVARYVGRAWEARLTAGKCWERDLNREGSGESGEVCGKGMGGKYDSGKVLEEGTEQGWGAGRAGRYMGGVWECQDSLDKWWEVSDGSVMAV
jgi:hypothetical protein